MKYDGPLFEKAPVVRGLDKKLRRIFYEYSVFVGCIRDWSRSGFRGNGMD
jgi:hypothetical protein